MLAGEIENAGNENKPEVLLSFDLEKMKEKKFLNDMIDIFHLTINDRNPLGEMPNPPYEVRTSWEGSSVRQIQDLVGASDNKMTGAPIRILNFTHYVEVIRFLIVCWYNEPDRPAIDFSVAEFTVRLRPNDLYCCPIKKGVKEISVPDKKLCYPTLKISNCFSKKCSETLWNYIKGNHDKVNKCIEIQGDATALCAVLFSEVIRNPDMFFHNILLMQHFKSWDEFYDNHPMLTGGSWKNQDQKSVPHKVRVIEKENLHSCVEKIMREKGEK